MDPTSRGTRRRIAAVVATVVAFAVGLVVAQAVIGSETDSSEPAPVAAEEIVAVEDVAAREGLTKVLRGMEYTGASEEKIAEIEARLDPLGGPDPRVPAVDGPDNAAEWEMQREIDKAGCEEGNQEACDALKISTEALGG